jgi:hypothetical protein
MLQEESLKQFIEQLSALPPAKRGQAYSAIQDQNLRRQILMEVPFEVHGDIMAHLMMENLNRNVQERMAALALVQTKPSQAA